MVSPQVVFTLRTLYLPHHAKLQVLPVKTEAETNVVSCFLKNVSTYCDEISTG